ncbi:flavin reductase family protein [Eubacteriaceae bacterium ES3]|nr:flavin reductase family protein [Eubacteriaceae bacterium ES3]
MSEFKSISPDEFDFSPFRLIGKEWMLISAESEGKVNSMTASWGGLGVMWGKNVAYVVIRKSRFTKQLVDASDSFSLTFFDHEKYQKMLGYMGSVSGRDENKIEKTGLTVLYKNGIPYFEEAKTVFLCKKLCRQYLAPESFIDESVDKQWYGDSDYHDLYIVEVQEILQT